MTGSVFNVFYTIKKHGSDKMGLIAKARSIIERFFGYA
jgi:hypothetical protein